MKVIGIDVAPSRNCYVSEDGKSAKPWKAAVLEDHLSKQQNVLIAWDAPLTGPSDPDKPFTKKQDLSIRVIERFFRRAENKKHGLNPDKGISTLSYCGCSHWTISRALLGLPRVGPYDAKLDHLPFKLLTNQ